MGELIPLHSFDTMSDPELIAYYRRAEDNAEQSISYIRLIGSAMQARTVSRYDDFHDVFPEDSA